MNERKGHDLVPYVEAYVSISAVAVISIGSRGKRIGKIEAWNRVDGPFKRLSDSAPSDLKVILRLKIQPKLRGSTEVPRQSQGHLRRNRSATAHDLIDRRGRHPQLFSQPVRAQLERLHEIVKQNVARMHRP